MRSTLLLSKVPAVSVSVDADAPVMVLPSLKVPPAPLKVTLPKFRDAPELFGVKVLVPLVAVNVTIDVVALEAVQPELELRRNVVPPFAEASLPVTVKVTEALWVIVPVYTLPLPPVQVPAVLIDKMLRVVFSVELLLFALSKQILSPVAGVVPLDEPPEVFDQLPLVFQLPPAEPIQKQADEPSPQAAIAGEQDRKASAASERIKRFMTASLVADVDDQSGCRGVSGAVIAGGNTERDAGRERHTQVPGAAKPGT